eukprot:14164097-Ditylum_brightwellii.AAC.1
MHLKGKTSKNGLLFHIKPLPIHNNGEPSWPRALFTHILPPNSDAILVCTTSMAKDKKSSPTPTPSP